MELRFIENSVESYLSVFKDLADQGNKTFLFLGTYEDSAEFLSEAKKCPAFDSVEFFGYSNDALCLLGGGIKTDFSIDQIQVVLIFSRDANEVSKFLLQYTHSKNCTIVAPITTHYFQARPVFIQSVPKSGTHLLVECIRAFGYKEPSSLELPGHNDEILPGHFYNLQHMPLSYIALPYSKIGKFIVALVNAVVIFIYRDPRDIAVSLAYYLAIQDDYHILYGFMKSLSKAQRLSVVLRGDYPIPLYINRALNFSGDLRELMLTYASWLKFPFPNQVSVKFEELVGPKGGGILDRQLETIWRLQLALHVPGRPDEYAKRVFSETTPTFRKGQIANYLEEFTDEHVRFLNSLPQDFMEIYGYKRDLEIDVPFVVWLTGASYSVRKTIAQCLKREIALCSPTEVTVLDEDAQDGMYSDATEKHDHAEKLRTRIAKTLGKAIPVCMTSGSPDCRIREILAEVTPNFVGFYLKRGSETVENRNGDKSVESDPEGSPVDVLDLDQLSEKACIDLIVDKLAELGSIKHKKHSDKPVEPIKFFKDSLIEDILTPVLIEESYKGFNIVLFKGHYLAISQRLGPMDLSADIVTDEYEKTKLFFSGTSLSEVKELVDQGSNEIIQSNHNKANPITMELWHDKRTQDSDKPPSQLTRELNDVPTLLEGNYHGFNLVQYRGKCYAMALDIGPLDLSCIDDRMIAEYQVSGRCYIGSGPEEVKESITRSLTDRRSHLRK